MSDSGNLLEIAHIYASLQEEFIQYFNGYSLEKVLGFLKTLQYDNRKQVFVVGTIFS